MPEESKEMVKSEIDDPLFERTCTTINQIFSGYAETAIREAGEYLILEFFENDHEKARKKNKIKNSSNGATLNQVFKHFTTKSSENQSHVPSRSWLYQAIDYVIQEGDIKSVQTSGNILLSHKVELLRVPEYKEKKKLINKVIKQKLTVRELREEISKNKNTENRNAGILTIIKKTELLSEENAKFSVDALKKVQLNKLEKYKTKLSDKKEVLQNDLKKFKKSIKDNNDYLQGFGELEKNIDKAIEFKNSETKKKSKA